MFEYMFTLNKTAPLLIASLGTPTFLALYLGAALSGSLGSMMVKLFQRNITIATIGASGAVFGVIGALVAVNDDSRLQLFFLPNVTFDARMFLPLYFVAEIIFNLVQKRVQVDNAVHILFGYLAMKMLQSIEIHKKPAMVVSNSDCFANVQNETSMNVHSHYKNFIKRFIKLL
jgi:membrane associated rhomboid family serine protease